MAFTDLRANIIGRQSFYYRSGNNLRPHGSRRKGACKKMKIETAIEGYWLVRTRTLSRSTVRDYSLTFRRLVDFLSPQQEFETITSHQLNLFMNHLAIEFNLKPKTQLNAHIALSSLWTWATKELDCEHPMRKVPKPRFHRERPEPYTKADIHAMLDACVSTRPWRTRTGKVTQTTRSTGLRDRAIIVTLLDTGMRANELCSLKVEDYNPTSGTRPHSPRQGRQESNCLCIRRCQKDDLALHGDTDPCG